LPNENRSLEGEKEVEKFFSSGHPGSQERLKCHYAFLINIRFCKDRVFPEDTSFLGGISSGLDKAINR